MQIRDRSHQSVSDLVLGSIDPFCRGVFKLNCFTIFHATAEPMSCTLNSAMKAWMALINNITIAHPDALWSFHAVVHICSYRPTPINLYVPPGWSFTFCEARRLGRVCQAELVFLPAAVVADQAVVGLLDVDVIADTEHVTSGLRHGKERNLLWIPFNRSPEESPLFTL